MAISDLRFPIKRSVCKNPRAFSLVEVVLALGLVSFCLIAVLGLMPVGLKVVKNANEQAAAASVLSSITRSIRSATTSDNSVFNWTYNGTNFTYTVGSSTPNVVTIDNLNFEGRTDSVSPRLKVRVEFAPPYSLTTCGQGTISVAWPTQADPTWDASTKAWKKAEGSLTTSIQFLPKP